MNDAHDDQAAPPPREKPFWKMKPHERLEWTRRQREAHRFVPQEKVMDDNASGDDTYDPFPAA